MPSIAIALAKTDGKWGGVVDDIPAGTNRTFLAQAFDSADTLRFEGRVENVTVVAGEVTLVTLTLQETSTSTPYTNEAPIIDSVVASPLYVAPGASIALVATAHDPNPSDTLVFSWTAASGSFALPTALSTSWTAPTSTGPVALKLTVSDSRGVASSVTLMVHVSAGEGSAAVDVNFNSPPKVTGLTSSHSYLDVGQQTTLTASASDWDGDSLSYTWNSTCAGILESAGTATARFTPTALPTATCNNCLVSVAITDGRGGQTTGTLALCVSKDATKHLPPTIVRSYQSSLTAKPSQMLTFEVVASDPEGSALSFVWTANVGSVGIPITGATNSRITWTASSCIDTGITPTIVATTTNAFNLKSTKSFLVTSLPVCASSVWTSMGSMVSGRYQNAATLLPNGKMFVVGGLGNSGVLATTEVYDPTAGTWSAASSMTSRRYNHTATLLPNGKVLVVGGGDSSVFATAEVYDPVSDTWSAASSMASPRGHHTATLLPNGKVLVSGGRSVSGYLATAEVYDSVSDTWSAAGSMASPRSHHTATLLPNGKVLVSGGRSVSGYLTTAEVYDPVSDTWSIASSMTSPLYGHTATLLPNGKVLVTGGQSGDDGSATTEVYDPVSDTWSAVKSMTSPRYGHTATLLPNGKVLVSAGYRTFADEYPASIHSTSEVYDPVSNTWSPVASKLVYRRWHMATLLLNGKVLISGGVGVGGYVPTVAELYTP